MSIAIIVEGKNDKSRLKRVVDDTCHASIVHSEPPAHYSRRTEKKSGTICLFIFSRIMMHPAKKSVFCCEIRFQTQNRSIHARVCRRGRNT